jgi:pimeloyl-ACP methyl ester carboxylesterase
MPTQQISCPNLVLPGRGHMLAIEDPDGTATTIVEFLRST